MDLSFTAGGPFQSRSSLLVPNPEPAAEGSTVRSIDSDPGSATVRALPSARPLLGVRLVPSYAPPTRRSWKPAQHGDPWKSAVVLGGHGNSVRLGCAPAASDEPTMTTTTTGPSGRDWATASMNIKVRSARAAGFSLHRADGCALILYPSCLLEKLRKAYGGWSCVKASGQ